MVGEKLPERAAARASTLRAASGAGRTGVAEGAGHGPHDRRGAGRRPSAAPGDAGRLERGLLVGASGDAVLRVLPPLVVSEADTDEAAGILEAAVGAVAKRPRGEPGELSRPFVNGSFEVKQCAFGQKLAQSVCHRFRAHRHRTGRGVRLCRNASLPALREEGIEVVLINSNPATIMTDTEVADTVYLEPLTPDSSRKCWSGSGPTGCCRRWAARPG